MAWTPHMANESRAHDPDDRVVLHDVTWDGYEAQLAIRGEGSAPRIAYLDGELELMTISKSHARLASWIGRLVEVYALHVGIELGAYRDWTLKRAPRRAGAEADECYIIGVDQEKDLPDLAIEVVWTHGGLDKLEVYRRLGVREVWFWIDGEITIHALVNDAYEERDRSDAVPGIDVAFLSTFLDRTTLTAAIRDYRDALRSV